MYIQDLDERLTVLIFGVLLLCEGPFFLVLVGLPWVMLGVEFFTTLDAKIAFFSTEQRAFIAKTVLKSESVVRVQRN
jgi:hypothetical protein